MDLRRPNGDPGLPFPPGGNEKLFLFFTWVIELGFSPLYNNNKATESPLTVAPTEAPQQGAVPRPSYPFLSVETY